MSREKIIEVMARELCRNAGISPDSFEPGDCPYHDNTQVVDLMVRGQPHFLRWRLFRTDAADTLTALEAAGYAIVDREHLEAMERRATPHPGDGDEDRKRDLFHIRAGLSRTLQSAKGE